MEQFILKIAGQMVHVNVQYSSTREYCREYLCEGESDFSVEITPQDIALERKISDRERTIEGLPPYSFEEIQLERTALYRKIAERLPMRDAFILHSATFDVDGVGVAFAAHSGTGKTTHMNLWQQFLGDKMVVVNGDKPIVRFFDDEPESPYAYGTPWNGKEHLGCNMRTPLKHICFIERSETNYVEKVQKNAVIDRIFNQVYMPKDPMAVMNTMKLIDRLLSCCNLWIIHCNIEPEAAEVAYNTIINGNIK
ncbi:MAG: hypothetical protein E7551_04305 [Ruminococcaceae bacterium]|nr:hypothetical protein [Oscillospiraceae bacterium]